MKMTVRKHVTENTSVQGSFFSTFTDPKANVLTLYRVFGFVGALGVCLRSSFALRHARPGGSLPAKHDSMSSPVTSEVHCGSRSRRSLPVMLWPSLTLHRCLLQQTARIRELTVSKARKEHLQWEKASAFWPAALRTGVSSRATSAILPEMRPSLAP